MKVKEKLGMDRNGLIENGPINIVIFGDSVSHGALNGTIDYEGVYWNRLKKMLNAVRSYVPVNMINASIGGTAAVHGVERMERQVLKHEPDLVIVCFGLNDVNGTLDCYLDSLGKIFSALKERSIDTVFMTPNMLNTSVAEDTPEQHYQYAIKTAIMQNDGRMDEYMSAAVSLAESMGVTVCDCYAEWKKLSETQDITYLLANRINHPKSEMHALFAEKLYEVIIGEKAPTSDSASTMYKG